MPANPPTQQMGERHEIYLAEINGGTRTRASGSQWFDQGDGRNVHNDPLAFCWDGKSTLGKSIGVTREMLAKIREQAQGERPQIGLRFYANQNLDEVDEDWVAVPGDNWQEVLNAGRSWIRLTEWLLENPKYAHLRSSDDGAIFSVIAGLMAKGNAVADGTREALREAHEALLSAGQRLASQDLELQSLRAGQPPQPAGPGIPPGLIGLVPRLPWAVIRVYPEDRRGKSAGDPAGIVWDYADDGTLTSYEITEVHVERSMANRPKVFADKVRIRQADVYGSNGKLIARCCDDDASVEVG